MGFFKPDDPPPAPDYQPLIDAMQEASDASFDFAEEQLAWAKEVYANDQAIVDKVVNSQLDIMSYAQENAVKDRERYEGTFQPLEDQLVADAQDYSSDERKEIEAGRAGAAVSNEYDAARQAAQRELESFGINPSATRYAALDIGVRTSEAAARAGAENEARRNVEDTGRQLRAQAIDIGRGYPGQSQAGLNQAGGAGSGAAGTTFQQTGSGASTMGTGQQWMSMGQGALGGAGSMMNNTYANQVDAYNAQQNVSTGFGSALGLAAGIAGKKFGFEDGGAVPAELSPSGGAKPDDVNAALTAGEFVMPQEAVSWFGEKHMRGLVDKAAKERAESEPKAAIPAYFQHKPQAGAPAAAIPLR